ncbi:MAG: hypothetical protein LBV17_08965 [Treponema sp.]|nr:hypothetical protein [Treponema sp.]
MQFTRSGNFSRKIGDMLVSGHYSLSADTGDSSAKESEPAGGKRLLEGRAIVFFGGLEFQLEFPPDRDNGLSLIDPEGGRRQVSSGFIEFLDNEAIFTLDTDSEISFINHNSGKEQNGAPELRISGKLAEGVSAVEIPFRLLRSSINRDGGVLNISYNENRYQFSRGLDGLEEGRFVLSAAVPVIVYRAVTDTKKVDPAGFILPQAETVQAFNNAAALWTAANFELWGKNMPPQGDEDMVIAWCAESLRRGVYQSAASVIPLGFSRSPGRTWESAVYQFDRRIGLWEREIRTIHAIERDKAGRVARQLAEKDIGIFTEGRIVEFLAVRGNDRLLDDVLSIVQDINLSAVSLETNAGIIEACVDMGKWHPDTANPFEALTDQILQLVVNGLYRNEDHVFIFSSGQADMKLNLRMGMALHEWGEKSGQTVWAGVGRSVVLSVISLANGNGWVPAFLTMDENNEYTAAADRISTAKLYRLLGGNEYLPHAAAAGANGVWAWTAASSVNVTQNDRQMDISVRFPVNETHYIMLRNVKPFPILQIYGQNWRRAADFESYYNASGWYYSEQEQTLVLKIAHRSNTELVRILFVAPAPPPPPPPPPPPAPPPEPDVLDTQ